MLRSTRALLAAALFLRATLALAEPAPSRYPPCAHVPTETDVGAAKGAFQAGNASFDEADYPRAIVYWEDAYRRDCTAHALLLNLARAYELNGDKAQAVVALETYLERAPNGPDREKIERRLDVLRKQIETDRSSAAAPAPPVLATPAPSVTPAPPAAPVEAAPVEPRERRTPIAPLIVAGAGGAIGVVGGILYAVAWSDVKDIEDACGGSISNCPTNRLAAEGDDASARVRVGGALTIGGLALAGGGLVWFFLERQQNQSSLSTGLTPIAAPGIWGLSYRGQL